MWQLMMMQCQLRNEKVGPQYNDTRKKSSRYVQTRQINRTGSVQCGRHWLERENWVDGKLPRPSQLLKKSKRALDTNWDITGNWLLKLSEFEEIFGDTGHYGAKPGTILELVPRINVQDRPEFESHTQIIAAQTQQFDVNSYKKARQLRRERPDTETTAQTMQVCIMPTRMIVFANFKSRHSQIVRISRRAVIWHESVPGPNYPEQTWSTLTIWFVKIVPTSNWNLMNRCNMMRWRAYRRILTGSRRDSLKTKSHIHFPST